MNLSLTTILPDTTAALRRAQAYRAPAAILRSDSGAQTQNLPATVASSKTFETTGTKLVSESRQELDDGGFRRTQTFEREDGRNFTRVEEFAFTDRGARRNVIQQNPSGSITQYEEVLDREGIAFRRTQRFQDEAGETTTQITSNYSVTDPFILTGGSYGAEPLPYSPFSAYRGTQLDLSA